MSAVVEEITPPGVVLMVVPEWVGLGESFRKMHTWRALETPNRRGGLPKRVRRKIGIIKVRGGGARVHITVDVEGFPHTMGGLW